MTPKDGLPVSDLAERVAALETALTAIAPGWRIAVHGRCEAETGLYRCDLVRGHEGAHESDRGFVVNSWPQTVSPWRPT